MAGIPESENVRLYEEVKPLRIDPLDLRKTLKQAELITGDVIIVENDFPEEERKRFDNPHVDQFFNNILNRIVVQFRKIDSPEEEGFSLVLNKKMDYMEVAKRVGERMGCPGNRVRLLPSPKSNRLSSLELSIKLEKMVQNRDNTLYVLEMDMTIEEFLMLHKIVVQFWQGARRYVGEELLMKKDATFGSLLEQLRTQVTLKGSKEIRMFISRDGYLEDMVPLEMEVMKGMSKECSLIAEEVGEEELELEEGDRLMKVMHFASSAHYRVQFHGVPFFVVIKKGDTYGEVKERIRKRLKVKKEGFSVWKMALIDDKKRCEMVSSTVIGFFLSFFP